MVLLRYNTIIISSLVLIPIPGDLQEMAEVDFTPAWAVAQSEDAVTRNAKSHGETAQWRWKCRISYRE